VLILINKVIAAVTRLRSALKGRASEKRGRRRGQQDAGKGATVTLSTEGLWQWAAIRGKLNKRRKSSERFKNI